MTSHYLFMTSHKNLQAKSELIEVKENGLATHFGFLHFVSHVKLRIELLLDRSVVLVEPSEGYEGGSFGPAHESGHGPNFGPGLLVAGRQVQDWLVCKTINLALIPVCNWHFAAGAIEIIRLANILYTVWINNLFLQYFWIFYQFFMHLSYVNEKKNYLFSSIFTGLY